MGLDASRAASAGAAAVSGLNGSESSSPSGRGEMRQWNGLAEYIGSLGPTQKVRKARV